MPLISFGAILTFAESIEEENKSYYQKALEALPDGDVRSFFEGVAKDKEKQINLVQRIRRENVSEMILEPIKDFTRQAFLIDADVLPVGEPGDVVQTAAKLEDRNLRYYTEAAKKIKALPEVATALKQLAKKQKKLLRNLEGLS